MSSRAVSAIFEAVVHRDLPKVVDLLARGADPNEEDGPSGQRPLLAAASNGDVEFVRALLDAGADVNATDRNGNTALSNAVYEYSDDRHGDYVPVLEALLEHGADPDKKNLHGVSPRKLAATIGSSKVEEALDAVLARHPGAARRKARAGKHHR